MTEMSAKHFMHLLWGELIYQQYHYGIQALCILQHDSQELSHSLGKGKKRLKRIGLIIKSHASCTLTM